MYKGCKAEYDAIGEPPPERPGTCSAVGCGYYEPRDKTTKVLGHILPNFQCCMCAFYGDIEGEPPPPPKRG